MVKNKQTLPRSRKKISKYKRVEGYAANLRKHKTPYETIILGYLDALHEKYVFQKIFYGHYGIPMIVDFYLPRINTVLEIDGAQHATNEKQHHKDELRDAFFTDHQINVIRITNRELATIPLQEFKGIIR